MPSKLFVNLPVKDLPRSVGFFRSLGYEFNPKFSDATAACLVISEENYAMLLTHDKFKEFITKPIAEAKKTTGVLISLSLDSRREVDEMVKKAVKAGGREHKKPQDLGFMYEWGFEDPDGHVWSYFWMDPKAVETEPPHEGMPAAGSAKKR